MPTGVIMVQQSEVAPIRLKDLLVDTCKFYLSYEAGLHLREVRVMGVQGFGHPLHPFLSIVRINSKRGLQV